MLIDWASRLDRPLSRGANWHGVHPSILEKSATASVAARISLSSLRRFARTAFSSLSPSTFTVTLSKYKSTCAMKGPYSSERSVSLMIARELIKEIAKRDTQNKLPG